MHFMVRYECIFRLLKQHVYYFDYFVVKGEQGLASFTAADLISKFGRLSLEKNWSAFSTRLNKVFKLTNCSLQ